jgi:hypothetical protein
MPNFKLLGCTTIVVCLSVVLLAGRSLSQESRGFKFNNLTVSPFVNLEYSYDSNVDYLSKNELDDSILRINPGVDLSYQGNMWGFTANAWYAYDWYKDLDQLNADSYGESVQVYRESAKGWRFVAGQSYERSTENDSIIDGGQGLWRDREQFDWTGALSYQFSEKTEVTLSGMYSDLSYVNDGNEYYPLYGWEEWTVGLELARKLTEKSNLLLSGSYQEYTSDGVTTGSDNSTGYTLHGGIGSRATERIRYHLLTGVSWFDQGDGDLQAGWTYSVDASWVISKKLAASVAGSSYFQPSEREANQAVQAYTLSAGLTYKPMRLLTTRFDLAYRREENQFDDVSVAGAYTDDRYSARARADYQLMRYVTLYGGLEYETQTSDDEYSEFDRYRATMGLNFRY